MELRDYLAVLGRRKVLIAGVVAVAALTALIVSLLAPREYTATTTLRLEPSSALVGGAVRADDLGYLDRLENTYANLARSAEVRDAAAQRVGLGQRPVVDIKTVANTDLMEVGVTTDSPRSAVLAANALAAELVARVKALNLASADEAEKLFDTRTARLQNEIADAENRRAELELAPSTAENRIQILRFREEITSKRASLAALVSDHQTLQLTREARAGALTIVAEATPPTRPSNRNLPLALVLSIVLGLVAGVAIALLAENLTHRVRTGDEIERAADAPVLGTVPTTRQVADASTSGDGSRAGAWRGLATTFGGDSGAPQPAAVFNSGSAGEEAFRRLATALLAAATKQPFKTLLVTSADPRAGKTTVVANVGRALAQSRRAVLLVDANLRWPRLHDVFDVPNEHGLSEVLIPGESEIVSSPGGIIAPPGLLLEPPIQPTSISGLWILPSGDAVRDPAMLLGSPHMEKWTESVAAGFDYVIFDSPALLEVSDAAALARTVDAVLLVTPPDIDRAELTSAVRELQSVDARLIGVVLNEIVGRFDRREPAKTSSVKEPRG